MTDRPGEAKGLHTIEMTVPSRLGVEKVIMAVASRAAFSMGFDEARVEGIKTAVSEACINAVEHGNQGDETLSLKVSMTLDPDAMEILAADEGRGGRPENTAPDIDRKMRGEETPRGLGLFLIKQFVDEVDFVQGADEGNAIRMVFRLKPS